MKIDIRSRSQAAVHIVLLAALVFSSLLLPVRATAALGGDEASVETDRQQMRAARAVRPNDTKYTVHELTTPYGTTVREYVSPDGKVFGVAWRGPFLPDFQQLLGDSFATFMQAAQSARNGQVRRSRNAPLTVEQPDLVVHSGGHVRAYVGHAYIPGMIPQGVSAADIK
jgi:hypothetical protein